MWKVPFPFEGDTTATTLEIFHGAHGEYETHAPIRTFVPYSFGDESHLLAAYLCTPMVTFRTSEMQDGEHLKGRTVAEFSAALPPDSLLISIHREDGATVFPRGKTTFRAGDRVVAYARSNRTAELRACFDAESKLE